MSLFEPISEDEYRRATRPVSSGARALVTEPRLQTIWFALPTHQGTCTVPGHDEVQAMLSDEKKEYREQFPGNIRYVYEISPGLFVCRDCFVAGADKE